MGRIIVRKRIEEKQPYVVPGLGIKVYSPEELVYVYYHNLPQLGMEIVDSNLLSWLEANGRKQLAGSLLQFLGREDNVLADFIAAVFSGIRFYTEDEVKTAYNFLREWIHADPMLRKKEKMDYLMDRGKIREAIDGYEELAGKEELADSLLGAVYHNLGVAYGKLFLFEDAAGYFKRAWQILGTPDSKDAYMFSLRMSLPKESYVNRIVEEGLGEEGAVLLEEKILEMLKDEEKSDMQTRLDEIKKEKQMGNNTYFRTAVKAYVDDRKHAWRKQYGDF